MERFELEATHAYRIYQNTHRGQYKGTETEVEKQERLVRTREYISKRITKVKDAHSYMTIRNQLNAFAQEIGRDNYSYIELENQLNRQIANIVEDNNTAIEKLQREINAMKAIKIEDTPEELTVLEQQAQQKMYEMLIKLKPNDTTGRNKRMLGNWVTHADRATALALTKIMLMPDYEKEFSERYKTILSEKIRKPEQIEHEKAVEPILKEMGTKLGKLFMCSFHLKQAMKSYHNQEVDSMGVDIYNQLPAIAKQAKRALTAQKRKKKIERLPEPPTLLSLNELAIKTGLSYQFLRKMIVEEKHVPYIKVGNKYIVNYELFLQRLGNMEGQIMETKTKVTDEQKEKLAYCRVISDAYKQRFKFRSVLFHCIMKHMLSKMHEETTIYYLMKEINCLHNCNKQSKKQ